MTAKTDERARQTVAAFARQRGFDRVSAWRAARSVPGLAELAPSAGKGRRPVFVVVDAPRLAAVLAERQVRGGHGKPRPPAPAGTAPAAGGSHGQD